MLYVSLPLHYRLVHKLYTGYLLSIIAISLAYCTRPHVLGWAGFTRICTVLHYVYYTCL